MFPDRVAIVYGERRSTYAEFADEAQRLAARIRSRIAPGDRVAFLAPNAPELLIAHFAVPLAGGVLVAINSRLARPEIEYILNHCEARLFFADFELLDKLDGIREAVPAVEAVVQLDDPTVADAPELRAAADVTYGDFMQASSSGEALPWTVEDENQLITINYTSGTTGQPKGVMYSHRGAYLQALGEVIHNGLDGDSRYLWTLPMFHCNGWCAPWGVTAAAATHMCLRAVRGDAVWDAIDTLGRHPPVRGTDGADNDRRCRGSPPGFRHPAHHHRRRAAVAHHHRHDGGPRHHVVHVYGLTEVYGPFTITEPQDRMAVDSPPVTAHGCIARQGVGRCKQKPPGRRCGDAATYPRTARRSARSSCAATT